MKLIRHFHVGIALSVLSLLELTTSQSAQAELIDFENIPGAYQGMPINNQFAAYGVTFSTEGGGSPLLGEVGTQLPDPNNPNPLEKYDTPGCFGFYYSGSGGPADGCDSAAPAYQSQLKRWFLTDDQPGVVEVFHPLLITYNSPVSAASGQIWDIDGTPSQGLEAWKIQALDQFGNVLPGDVSLVATLGTNGNPPGSLPPYPGDGVPTTWSFDYGQQAIIKSIRISYLDRIPDPDNPGQTIPTKRNVGLAFDNFNTNTPSQSVPEPSSAIGVLALGAFGVGSWLKRKIA